MTQAHPTPPTTTEPLRVLYLGDHKGGSGRYVAGALRWAGFDVTHHDCYEAPPMALLRGERAWDVVILSDYASATLTPAGDSALARLVERQGVGLIMLGGWDSFTGLRGMYRSTQVGKLLPVRMLAADDRRNRASGMLLWPTVRHPITTGLSFASPPCVVGHNAVFARKGAQVLMTATAIKATGRGARPKIEAGIEVPMLVVGDAGQGRALAFCTDLAPHWCGGLVDWGRTRVHVDDIEVGENYLEMIRRLVLWAARRL